MTENKNLLSAGLSMVMRNKRYIVWFFLLHLFIAYFGASTFGRQAHSVLDQSMEADKLLHGFQLTTLIELFTRPEFGSMGTGGVAGIQFAIVFFLLSAMFVPGVLAGYGSTYRLPRDEFFRACGRNLWRFIRLLLIAGVIMLPVTVGLFLLHGVLEERAADSTNELLVPEVQFIGLFVIFLIMSVLRIWFDLAQADVVLNDQNAVRRSIAAGFRHTFKGFFRLLGSYLLITVVAAIILVGGIAFWWKFVPSASVGGAFLVGQLTLLLLLVPRFWQRGVAVAYWEQAMVEPIAPAFMPAPVAPMVSVPSPPTPVPPPDAGPAPVVS